MKKISSGIVCVFLYVFAYGQVTLAVSEVREQKVNQQFTVTVLLEILGENMEQETPLRLPDTSKFDIIGTASEQNTVVLDAKKGNVLNQMIYQFVLAPKQVGKIKFGSVLVTVNGKIYKTEPFDIMVREHEKKSAPVAKDEHLALQVELSRKSVYANEPVIAVVRARGRNFSNFRNIRQVQFAKQRAVRVNPAPAAKAEIESSRDQHSQILGTYVLQATESGTVNLKPVIAKVALSSGETTLSSNATQLHVKAFPSGTPSGFKNAVGNFSLSLDTKNLPATLEIEKPVNITLHLKGTGNLNTVELPKIEASPQYVSFPPKITSKTDVSAAGISGEITADYLIIPKIKGPVTVKFEPFSFFNPETKSYVQLGSTATTLDVKTPEEILAARSTLERMNDYTNTVLETVNTPVLQTQHLKIKRKDSINWNVVAGNLALLSTLLAAFFLIRKQTRKKKTSSQLTPIATVSQTEDLLREQWLPQIQDHLLYLQKLHAEGDYEKFFCLCEQIKTDSMRYLKLDTEQQLKDWIISRGGVSAGEQFVKAGKKIQIEKYAPFVSPNQIDTLISDLENVYSLVEK